MTGQQSEYDWTGPWPVQIKPMKGEQKIMKRYIGTKIIHAEPAAAPIKMGSHVEGEPGMKVRYEDGYESWSPQDAFDKAYRPCDAMNFGLAIEVAKLGRKIARKNWNGPGQYIVYQKGYPTGIPINKNTSEAIGQPEGTACRFSPYLMIRTTDEWFAPWVPSQTDQLAEDWMIVD